MKRKYYAVKDEFELYALFDIESHANDYVKKREPYGDSDSYSVEPMMISDFELADYKDVAMFDLDICDLLEELSEYTRPSGELALDLYYSESARHYNLMKLLDRELHDRVEQVFGNTRGVDLEFNIYDVISDDDWDIDTSHDAYCEHIAHNEQLLSDWGSRIQQFLDIIEKE